MKPLLLAIYFLSLSSYAQIDMGGLTGTVNQVKKDPAQRRFEKEYEELEEVMEDLEEHKKLKEKERPPHHIQDEPFEQRVDE